MEKRRITLDDLARHCGVSAATVSRALAKRPGVRPDLRDKIHAAAVTLGYPLPLAMAGRKAILIAGQAAMTDAARSQFTLHVLEGLRARAALHDLTLELRAADGRLIDAIRPDDDAMGYLLLSPGDDQIAEMRATGLPCVLVNADDPEMQLSSAAPNNSIAAARATDRLIALGHRRIAFLTCGDRRTIARRRAGWRERMEIAGLVPDTIIEVSDWVPALAAQAVTEWFTGGRDATALLAAGDSLAVGALMALSRIGINVPGDVSVMGFDGMPQCALQSPPLSAVEIPMAELGAVALDLLRDTVAKPDQPAKRVELACRVVERGSTGPART
ncbi:Catabolite control protein A [Rhodobacteraceae bacterium THAF1]|uniref:LacI family DNA-binding transcriptional regulator n=1 Tax=Palleronia sp. THAF1 TaxID=2587842 RepID=UPI000F3D911A|nr:LacI family DNA-binding transcriptional regulator [Palleronia sp. THAF1]QFU08291.1 Catabolite control protein A [Palleronia sp. THAF1]VDC28897.1 Catabolite control protein A [Rhodobacteraceae bacterium THAF1]